MKTQLLTYFTILLVATSALSQNFVKSTINASTGTNPYTITSGYLDDDAYLDIAIGTYIGNTVEWYKNNGDGTFATAVILVATAPNDLLNIDGIAIADINGDGDNDILVTGYSNNNLVWFENLGSGTFANAVTISSSIAGAGVVMVANIDNDVNGYLDVIVTAYDGNSVIYMLGNGDGTFGSIQYVAPVASGSGPGNIDIADFDGDGDLDIVVGFTANGDVYIYNNRVIEDGTLSFVRYDNPVSTGNGYLWAVSFADINDDGNLDVIKSDYAPGANPNIAWYSNDSSGTDTTFTETTVSTSILNTAIACVADFNNDTYNDLLVTNGRSTDDDFIWFTSDASGGLGSEIFIDNSSGGAFDIEIQDFDNDGDLDIAGISYLQHDLYIFINDFITLDVDTHIIETISIYPNPTSNILNFKMPSSENFQVSVYNILGENIINKTIENNSSLDVSNLSNGVYIIKFNDYNKTFKFVKE